ncbi:protocatechuate 3,4-dioxygenase subunit alpha [Pseudonocardia oroxyli]|uniref:Protocatechuate 3,4-dioxygenase alpha subunit n=1 Tax=Pseudonocardia oroxyli TaxID=366584 RepID=A0A1G7VMQ8_PSEOR|nr:protocatechuate 3,4-dioxygenase subunit alpha [Pseudonocardia oroxyli]SDG61004.1 protocatechuate 3,4-dioxygenase alpha subunit [Pseudonocardia oroxyli]
MPELTPSQTVGPYLRIGLDWADGPDVVPSGGVTIGGTVYDGAGAPITDAMVETWQADPQGRFPHPLSGGTDFRGFGRSCTDGTGRWEVHTLLPGALPGEAPHLDVSVFARGLLDRVVTRIYLPEPGDDPVLAAVPQERRHTLIAERVSETEYRFDIHLQGAQETVFFDF